MRRSASGLYLCPLCHLWIVPAERSRIDNAGVCRHNVRMSIETAADLEALREVGRVTRETLDALEQHVRDGITTAELDAVAAAVFAKNGARSAPALVYGFPGTVLISVN